jgi:hypothetical protein
VEQRIPLIHGTPDEYITHARPFVGSGSNRGCRTLWFVGVRVLTSPRAGLALLLGVSDGQRTEALLRPRSHAACEALRIVSCIIFRAHPPTP